jgi:hypothetical protein
MEPVTPRVMRLPTSWDMTAVHDGKAVG